MAFDGRSNEAAPADLAAVSDALTEHLYASRSIRALLAGASAVLQDLFDDDGEEVASALSLIRDATDRLEGITEGLDLAQLSLAQHRRSAGL